MRERAEESSPIHPRFVLGRPEDFIGVQLDSMVLVYSGNQLRLMRAHSPDFHGTELGPVVFNMNHDRGVVIWSMGWTGGSLRLIRQTDGWGVEVMLLDYLIRRLSASASLAVRVKASDVQIQGCRTC